jgi:hypothetical protein
MPSYLIFTGLIKTIFSFIPQIEMKSLQLTAIIVLSITIAMVTTVMIIMSVGMVKKCPQCPPCEERLVVIEEEEVPSVGLNIEQRAPTNLPPLPQMEMEDDFLESY